MVYRCFLYKVPLQGKQLPCLTQLPAGNIISVLVVLWVERVNASKSRARPKEPQSAIAKQCQHYLAVHWHVTVGLATTSIAQLAAAAEHNVED